MKIQLDSAQPQTRIRHYASGSVTVNQAVYRASVVVLPDRVLDWAPQRFEELAPPHFAELGEFAPQVVLLGTGERLRFPSPGLTRALTDAGIGLEVMDTGAACRTYNLLAGEGRRVLAALLMIGA